MVIDIKKLFVVLLFGIVLSLPVYADLMSFTANVKDGSGNNFGAGDVVVEIYDAASGGNLIYKGNLGTFVSVIGELEIAATGFNEFFAEQNGYNIVSAKAKSLTKPDWFPGGKEITVKILADKKTGKIIGGQAIGEGASHRINVLSAAIKAGFTLGDLSDLELAYCPGVSQHYDVLVMAADLGLRKLGK